MKQSIKVFVTTRFLICEAAAKGGMGGKFDNIEIVTHMYLNGGQLCLVWAA